MSGLLPFDHQHLRGMTVDQARLILHNHPDCDTATCPRKRQARDLLARAHETQQVPTQLIEKARRPQAPSCPSESASEK